MQALMLETTGGVESAALREVPAPAPGPGELRVALRAAALNHREIWIGRGLYPGMKLPCSLGADGAGVVAELGAGVDPALLGRAVVLYPGIGWGEDHRFPAPGFAMFGMPLPGTIAEQIVVPADCAFDKPAHLDFEQAASLPTAGITAWRGLAGKAQLREGETMLVTGVGGGVASFALLFGLAMGARVFVTSGSPASLARAEALGAAGGFDYRDPDWAKALRRAAGGLDVVFDGAPAAGLADYARALKHGARVVIYGSTGGTQMHMSAPDLFLRHVTLYGTAMGDHADFAAMLDFIAARRLVPDIARSFPLAAAREALLFLQDGHGFGKVTIRIGAA